MGNYLSRRSRTVGGIAAVATSLLLLAACSGQSADTPSASTGGEVDLASAEQLVSEYSTPPTDFPVDIPLGGSPEGLKISVLQCVTPTCGLAAQLFVEAAQTMGVDISFVKVSASIADQQSGMDAIIASEPDGVIVLGIEASAVGSQIEALTSSDVAVTTIGLADVEKYGVQAPLNSNNAQDLYGEILAAYVLTEQGGDADSVVYNVPELGFPQRITDAYVAKLSELCPSCGVRVVDIPITSVGTDAPSRVIADLQANPSTNIAVFPFLDLATGLPAALSTADIEIQTVGTFPSPSNTQDVKNGAIGAAVAIDNAVMFWTGLDATARVALGEPLTEGEKQGAPPLQIITAEDITYDPAGGWRAFPDYKERFAVLWTVD